MPEYPPKLWEGFKDGGDCVVCGDGIEAGQNGWLYKGRVACPHHTRQMVLDAVDKHQVEMRAEAPQKPVEARLELATVEDRLHAIAKSLEAINLELRKIADMGVKVRQ